uniref:NADH dehydrogenase subunit 6 n=1 Tax=Albulina orbitula TaxID=689475 RepID=UPI0022F2D681|nr:NADH dehydrogenase subunit 6 [Agriades orbitulus]WAK98829.1 NADH dehydrogenase subunit 6 [Agriades orbitulus]WAK98842.1 NADH dehydrogenase subunit 6 [Agriades orbitulus]WAK98855.1 NADH dehydrogenase subunit 6 [Agriades orbitulus]
MIKMLLTLSLIFLSITMFFINHPLSMGMLILIQTILLCLISGMLINTYWFSYILFLTFSGGLLVLFIYVSSIASNEMFKINMKNKLFMLIYMITLFTFSLYFMNNLYWMNMMINEEMMNLFNSIYFLNEFNNINLSKLYNKQTYLLMMMMIIYLFITLIAVVKITNIFFGPLRSFN